MLMKITKEHQSLLFKISDEQNLSQAQAMFLVKEIEEQRDRERSRKSIQAVREMMLVLNKQ